jgi:hypothetical protein
MNLNTEQDPYLDPDRALKRLEKDYFKHPDLIVAVDFDSTIFDLHKLGVEFTLVRNLIRECKEVGFKIVIYTASSAHRYEFVRQFCKENNIPIDGLNEDISDRQSVFPERDYSTSKIYYNIFLCDRAGLESAYKTLRKLVDNIKAGVYNKV